MSWRGALPRVGIHETSELSTAALAAALASAGERVAALQAYREVLLASPDDEGALGALGAILGRLGRDEEGAAIRGRLAVIAVARMSLSLEHRADALAFELALDGLGPVPAAMPAGYAAALFDTYAPRFDARLRDDLRYRAPELLVAALMKVLVAPDGPGKLDVCDVGCGTGLLGSLLRPLARRLDGVDRSPRMLERASALHVYDDLVEADLTEVLTSRPGAYDLVTAADVMVYIGDIAPVFVAAATALRRGGLLAFTVEQSEEAGYRLTATGRYQQASTFVRESAEAAGLTEVSADEGILRREQGQPVLGIVWVLRQDAPGPRGNEIDSGPQNPQDGARLRKDQAPS